MKFYTIDHSKVRFHYEIGLIIGQASKDEIMIKGVKYIFNELSVVSAKPQNKNAYALTTKGFVRWKNPTREIDPSGQEVFKQIGYNGKIGVYIFCSNYICISKPSFQPDNVIKITRDNIKLIEFEGTKPERIVKPEEVKAQVSEKEDELEIDFTQTDRKKMYDIAVEKEDEIYNFYPYYLSMQKVKKVIIARGTCFKTQIVSTKDYILENEDFEYRKEYYDVCFE